MLDEFWRKEKVLISIAGLSATLGALFLNVPIPQTAEAKTALANIQVFWLILLTISLTGLFINFMKLAMKRERKISRKYDLPFGIFSLTLASVFLIILWNFWLYIFSLYGKSLLGFLNMIFSEIVAVLCVLLALFMETRRKKFTRLSAALVYSFILAITITTMGILVQEAIWKYFYLYWLYFVLPGLFLISSITLVAIALFKRMPLLKTLPTKAYVRD